MTMETDDSNFTLPDVMASRGHFLEIYLRLVSLELLDRLCLRVKIIRSFVNFMFMVPCILVILVI